jgi:hypothetical protein
MFCPPKNGLFKYHKNTHSVTDILLPHLAQLWVTCTQHVDNMWTKITVDLGI